MMVDMRGPSLLLRFTGVLLLAACRTPDTTPPSAAPSSAPLSHDATSAPGSSVSPVHAGPSADPRSPAPAASASTPVRPFLDAPNPARAELGLLARYADYTRILSVAGSAVLIGCNPSNSLMLKILDADLLHGKDIAPGGGCMVPVVLGDVLVFGSNAYGASPPPAIAVHVPSGLVEPFVHFNMVLKVEDHLVLAGCDATTKKQTFRILEPDIVHGLDVATSATCSASFGRLGDTILFGTEPKARRFPVFALHVPSGTLEPHLEVDGGPKFEPAGRDFAKRETVLGKMRYRNVAGGDGAGDAFDGGDHGVFAFDRESDRPLWHALWGAASLPLPSEGALVVRMANTLAELDPATGNVLWERGVPGGWGDGVTEIAPLESGGADAFGVVEVTGLTDPRRAVVIFKRGAAPDAAWTGKIYGTVSNIGKGGNGRPYAKLTVMAGSKKTKTDAHGKYEIALTASGIVTVDTEIQLGAGSSPDPHALEVAAGHGDYKVDLKVGYFDQACR